MSEDVIGAHNGLRSEQGGLPVSSEGAQPIRSSRCRTSSGWSSRSRTWSRPRRLPTPSVSPQRFALTDELHLRGSDARAPCVLIRTRPSARSSSGRVRGRGAVGSGAAGRRDRDYRAPAAGVARRGDRQSGRSQRAAGAGRVGHPSARGAAHRATPHVVQLQPREGPDQRDAGPTTGTHQRAAARTHRGADPEVHRSPELVPRHVRHDRQ